MVKSKKKLKSQKQIPKKKVSLELLHLGLGHRSTMSLLAGDTVNVWQYIDPRVDPDPFCTSCQIFTTNKNSISKTPQKPKSTFEWILWI